MIWKENKPRVKKSIDLKISVIITTYNRKYEVTRALKSVLAQTVQPFEIIVVDDGSTDGTQEHLQNHIHADFKYIYNSKTKGPGRSRNIGIVATGGDYIAFLDSDNEWYNNKLLVLKEKYVENPEIDIICARYKKHIEFGVYEYPGDVVDESCSIKDEILLHNIADASATLYKKTFLEKIDGFNETMITNIDWELLLRAFTIYTPRICKIPNILSENWQMDDGISFKVDKEMSERMAMLSTYWRNVSEVYLKILFYKQYERDHKEFDSEYLKKINYYKWIGYDKDWMKFEFEYTSNLCDIQKQEAALKEKQLERKNIFYAFLVNWLKARQNGNTIADVLEKKNIKTIAIYGLGKHGHLALNDLINSDILIKYIIDKNIAIENMKNIEVLNASEIENFPQVDAIIITPFLEISSIIDSLKNKTSTKLLSLQELVEEASHIVKEK